MKNLGLVGLILVLGLMSLPTSILAQDDVCFERGGYWDTETGQCRYQAGLTISIDYPLEYVDHEFADITITEYLNAARRDFMTNFTEYGLGYSSVANWELNITYGEFRFSEDIVSIQFNIYEYSGGAHGNIYFETFTFDLANQKILNFDDLFQEEFDPLVTIAPIVQADLETQLGDMTDSQWIQDGTGSNPNNYRNFIITGESLIFLFPPYQVAAYVAGPQSVTIPLADLQSILVVPFLELGE